MAVAEPRTPGAQARRARPGPLRAGHARKADVAAAGLLVLVTLIALLAPVLAPHNPIQPVGLPQQPPGSNGFLLGTAAIGRAILSRAPFGWRSSWFAALAVIASGLIVGGLAGLAAGALGGVVDTIVMRITDGFLALPAPVLAIVGWPFYARIVRGEIRTIKARPHVEAARLAGVGRAGIAVRHLLPGALPAAIVTASLDVGNLVLTLASLSFLGLGQPQPAPELGADTARNLPYLLQQWWIPVMPGLAVLVMALAANVAGDGVRNLLSGR